MTFSSESIADRIEEAKPLLFKHWQELEADHFPLDPDFDLYIYLETKGIAKGFSCRNDKGEMVGYAVYLIKKHPHYKTVLFASCDIIFLDKSCRGQGLLFLDWCDQQMKALGAQGVEQHVKVNHDFSAALVRNGYKAEEIKLIKRF